MSDDRIAEARRMRDHRELMARIEALEARIAELEQRGGVEVHTAAAEASQDWPVEREPRARKPHA